MKFSSSSQFQIASSLFFKMDCIVGLSYETNKLCRASCFKYSLINFPSSSGYPFHLSKRYSRAILSFSTIVTSVWKKSMMFALSFSKVNSSILRDFVNWS